MEILSVAPNQVQSFGISPRQPNALFHGDDERSGCVGSYAQVRTGSDRPCYSSPVIRPSIALVVASVVVASCAKATPVTLPPPLPADAPSIGHLIPLPRTVEPAAGPGFTVTADTMVVVPPGDDRAMWVATYLAEVIGLAAAPRPPRVEVASGPVPRGSIALELGGASITGAEAYELTSGADGITIRANQPAGLFYGVQTLRQLLPAFVEYTAVRPDTPRPVVARRGRIVDEPRFAWRGAMLDVARHFLPVDDVKRYIDLMALYKLNRLHLHLADDQGWRIEIKSWPNLAAHGGSTEVGGGAGGFYTQEQYADIVALRGRALHHRRARDRHAGPHQRGARVLCRAELRRRRARRSTRASRSASARSAWKKDITYTFIDDVVREIAAITPAPWFHIGGDEVKTLTPAQYARFVERVQAIVQSHGKQMIGWDESRAGRLLPTPIVQHWRPKASPEARGEGAQRDHVDRRAGVPRHEVPPGHAHRPHLGRIRRRADGLRLGPGHDRAFDSRISAAGRRGAALVGNGGDDGRRGVPGVPEACLHCRGRVVPRRHAQLERVQ